MSAVTTASILRVISTVFCSVFLTFFAFYANRAAAYEDTLHIAVDAFYVQTIDPSLDHGLGVGLTIGHGVDDVWNAQVRASYQWMADDESRIDLRGEWLYVVDVLSLVPQLGVAIVGSGQIKNGDFEVFGGLGGVFQLDYLLTRSHTVGIDLRMTWLFDDELTSQSQWNIGIRYVWLFEDS